MQRGALPPGYSQQQQQQQQQARAGLPRGVPSAAPPHAAAAQAAANAQQQAQQAAFQETLRKREDTRNRSKKPTDRTLPLGVADIIIGDGAAQYERMLDQERRLDAMMMRRRLDVEQSVYRDSNYHGTMRIWISNTVENQPWQYSGMDPAAFDFNSGVEATFRVNIDGRILKEPDDPYEELLAEFAAEDTAREDAAEARLDGAGDDEPAAKRARLDTAPPQQQHGDPKRFSEFFKAITIDFDRPAELQPDGYTSIEWKRPDQRQPLPSGESPKEPPFTRLTFQRKADENINITINLHRDENPEVYLLARPLAELLDMEAADRPTVLMGIWEYIKMAGVRMDDDKRQIYCDHRLQSIFGTEVLYFPTLRDAIRPLMFERPPTKLKYTIRADQAFHTLGKQPDYTIYDVRVQVPDPLQVAFKRMTARPAHIASLQRINQINNQTALLMVKMAECTARHKFFSGMAKDPAGFIKRWISSQQRDLDVMLGKGAWSDEDWQGAEWRKGGEQGIWHSQEAQEAVASYLARQRQS